MIAFCMILSASIAWANLIYHPISFVLSTDKDSYYEGEKITFLITITNNDKEKSYPVLLPDPQRSDEKLFYLNVYDKANNTLLLRYTEEAQSAKQPQDRGLLKIKYLKPGEQIVVPIQLNNVDTDAAHNRNTVNHSFGIPLFAGVYKVNVSYKPKGNPSGDSIYAYYSAFDKNRTSHKKILLPEEGILTQMTTLKIKRSADTLVHIGTNKYFVKTDGYRFYYLSKNTSQITTDTSCHHISNLPTDSCSVKDEYFYSHFNDMYAEYIARFEDGDIKEYRKFSDWCPSYLYTERYNDSKQKTQIELQLPDKTFYSVSYNQPEGTINYESYCSADGTRCEVTQYHYNKTGALEGKEVQQTQPCLEITLEGKKRSVKRVENLKGK